MRLLRLVLPGLSVALVVATAVSCSDANDDPIGRACRVIVDGCGVGRSMGECVDEMGDLPFDCIECIASSDCGYATCQRSLSGCRIPVDLLK